MAKMTNLTVEQIESLRTYLDKANHGHGRLTGVTRQLWQAGYLSISWTGMEDWTLRINAKGRRVLEVVASHD
jgi:hypothetical protein